MNLNGNYYSYSYYQGYHDLALFIYLIFHNNIKLGVFTFQRISEFFFKDYLDPSSESNDFGFHTALQMITYLIEKIDPITNEKIIQLSDVEYHHFSLAWVIGWFTHSINDLHLVYRIIDYLLCSHPLTIYYLSSILIIEVSKTLSEKRENLVVHIILN